MTLSLLRSLLPSRRSQLTLRAFACHQGVEQKKSLCTLHRRSGWTGQFFRAKDSQFFLPIEPTLCRLRHQELWSLKYGMKWKVIGDIWLSDPHITPQCKSRRVWSLSGLWLFCLSVDHGISLVISTGSSSNGSSQSHLKRRD